MDAPVEQALKAVRGFARGQGVERPEPTDDTLTDLRYEFAVTNVEAALGAVPALIRAGGSADMSWAVDDDGSPVGVAVSAVAPSSWQVGAGEDFLVKRLRLPEAPPQFSTDQLAQTLAGAESARATVTFAKGRWIEQLRNRSGRNGVWVGPTAAGFGRWVAMNFDTAIREVLGAPGGALVAVEDGAAQAPAGRRLVVVEPGTLADAVPDDPLLVERLERSGYSDDLPLWRAAQVDAPDGADEQLARTLGLAVTWAAATALADVREPDALRPSRGAATEWPVEQRDAADAEPSEAVIELARWTAESFDETGLEVARAVAAEKLPNAFAAHPADPVVRAARIAYEVAIKNEVRESLARQSELEKAYLEADAEMARSRESVAASVDQVVTRALTGALAVAIAALTAKQVRGWPVTIAGGILGTYLLANAVYTARPIWRAARDRLESLRSITAGRRDLSTTGITQVSGEIDGWRSAIKRYVGWATALLVALAIAAYAGAVLGNERISPLFDDPDEQPEKKRAP